MRPCHFWSRSCWGGSGQRRTPPGWTLTTHSDLLGPAICSAPSCAAVGGADSSLSEIPHGCHTCSESREAPGFCHLPDINTNVATCDHWGSLCPLGGWVGGAEREVERVSGFERPPTPRRDKALQRAEIKLEGGPPSVQSLTPETPPLHASGELPLVSVSLICMGYLHADSTDWSRGPPVAPGHGAFQRAFVGGQCQSLTWHSRPILLRH